MSQRLSYITLESIVNDYLIESEQSVNKFYKAWQIAFRGMEDLGIDFFYAIRSVKIPVLANKTFVLPPDYLNWSKVGRLNSRGEIIPLYYNDKLTTFADLSSTRATQTQDDSTIGLWGDWGANTWANYWNGASYTNIYGQPSGAPFAGNFKIDLENGVGLLDEHYHEDYIMIEYVSNPQSINGQDFNVPVQFREALIAWLVWKDGKAKTVKTHMQLGTNRDNKHDYYTERRKAIARWKPIRVYDIYQVSQEMTRQAIKT